MNFNEGLRRVVTRVCRYIAATTRRVLVRLAHLARVSPRLVLGVALVWGSVGLISYRIGWGLREGRARATLLSEAQAATLVARRAQCHGSGRVDASPGSGVLLGTLDVPVLGLRAPVEQGTSGSVLDVAAGHAPGTPLPGQVGMSVLLAHDVSYFSDIALLHPGAEIRYESGCTRRVFRVVRSVVVHAGAPVPSLSGSVLVLDTCWPTDALWFTPDRYLVEAREVGMSRLGARRSATAPVLSTATYSVPAPAALRDQGLGLRSNSAPMGPLTLKGSPSSAWVQSPGPLTVEKAALAAYFGGLRAAGERRPGWWYDLAPGLPVPAPLRGASVATYVHSLHVTITAAGTTPSSVELRATLVLAGGGEPGRYAETVAEAVHGHELQITSWGLKDA